MKLDKSSAVQHARWFAVREDVPWEPTARLLWRGDYACTQHLNQLHRKLAAGRAFPRSELRNFVQWKRERDAAPVTPNDELPL